jgi:hypothetical protein
MADLTTVDGYQISFDPRVISVVTDHDANTGAAVTSVYGITNGILHISESVTSFLKRLGIERSFATLTRPNSSAVWINGASVSSLRSPLPGEFVAGVNTVLSVGSFTQGIEELPAAAKAALNACGANL